MCIGLLHDRAFEPYVNLLEDRDHPASLELTYDEYDDPIGAALLYSLELYLHIYNYSNSLCWRAGDDDMLL